MNDVDISGDCLGKMDALLNTYLCEFGISSEATRERWIKRVVEDMATNTVLFATDDVYEDALEHMRDLIEARVAAIGNLDPVRDHKEIAQILVVLLDQKYADSRSMLFEHIEPDAGHEILERLRNMLAASLPSPVPEETPVAMPVQTIKLRYINPFKWLFGRSA